MEVLSVTLVEGMYLSSETTVYKTEKFLKETNGLAGADRFLERLGQALLPHIETLFLRCGNTETDCYCVSAESGAHKFFFKLGKQIVGLNEAVTAKDIVFFANSETEPILRNDQRLVAFMRVPSAPLEITHERELFSSAEFKKLYRLSGDEHINLPLLNDTQRAIVLLEDENVLVQGVAGSGKTNVCIEKLVFAACRDYAGRVLYSTYSRGLLIDTQTRVGAYVTRLREFVDAHEQGKLIFFDKDVRHAVENRLGVYLSEETETQIVARVQRIIRFLEERVDYFLIEDIYRKLTGKDTRSADEAYFLKSYVRSVKDHQLAGKLKRISHLSYEVIFKEINGLALGGCNPSEPTALPSAEQYRERRRDSFGAAECEIIYSLARDYRKHLLQNKLTDNNLMSRELLERADELSADGLAVGGDSALTSRSYSLAILDEVQDMTEVNLVLMKRLARKLFCVGDALQMINPSYFGFAYLKRLLYEKDVVGVAELAHNYRNTKRIAEIVDGLATLNEARFGVHSFVLQGESVDDGTQTTAVFVEEANFVAELARQNFENVTVVTASQKEKERLRALLKSQEILTVSEIKGLERDTVVLCNVLSENTDKWQALERTLINRKQADENSVYRYYFNLFYVGISRAKSHLFVYEQKKPSGFDRFFEQYFESASTAQATERLARIAARIEIDEEELLDRIRQFINQEQYDNARFAAGKLRDDRLRTESFTRIDAFESFIRQGHYREAGIFFWESNMTEDARAQFKLSGDDSLIQLMDACAGSGSGSALGVDAVRFLPDVEANETARRVILGALQNDLKRVTERQKKLRDGYRQLKERKNG